MYSGEIATPRIGASIHPLAPRTPTLAPGASRVVRPGEEAAGPADVARLRALLPAGSALAEGPETLWVALPPVLSDAGGRP